MGAFICADVRVRSDESNYAMGKTVQACANACRVWAAGRWTGRPQMWSSSRKRRYRIVVHDDTSANWEESTCMTKVTMIVSFSIQTIAREKLWHRADNEY